MFRKHKEKKEKQIYPKKVWINTTIASLLTIIPVAFVAYKLMSTQQTIVFVYLPIVISLYLLLSLLQKLTDQLQEREKQIQDLDNKIQSLEEELHMLKQLKKHEIRTHNRQQIFKEFIKELNAVQTPTEIFNIIEKHLKNYFPGIKGFSILIKSKAQNISPTPLIRVGNTSPPQIKAEIPGRDTIFYINIGYIPENIYKQDLEDTLEMFNIALKRWEDLKGSITDPLTGAYNRQFLSLIKDYLESPLSQYTLLLIDLDGFKEVNDTLGHNRGDEILINTVKKIQQSLRGEDILIRYGGDEFIVIINDTTMENGLRVAERIRLSIRNNLISASIGAVFKKRGIKATLGKLIKLADALMYIAKKEKDKVVGGKWEGISLPK